MKTLSHIAVCLLLISFMTSCGDGQSSSSSKLFGSIPGTLESYNSERESIESSAGKDNYKEVSQKIDNLKEETTAKLEETAKSLNGKEFPVAVSKSELKVEEPLTLEFKNVFSNLKAVEFGLTGKIVAATDLALSIPASDLKDDDLLGGSKVVITAYLPVHLEFLDKEENVVDTRTIGRFTADNNGETAVIKTGTPIELNGTIPVSDKYVTVESARLVIDLDKGLTSRGLAK